MYSEKPTPFYLSYPLPYDTEEAVGREWEILKSWYSDEVLQMQEAVERAATSWIMRGAGSMMNTLTGKDGT